jgi:NADPH:quinone reductase-like Zn-dependent oxidoreductase
MHMGYCWRKRTLDKWNPMEGIRSGLYLMVYSGGQDDFIQTPLSELAKQIVDGSLTLQLGKVFMLDKIVEAHALMQSNKAKCKIVVRI